MKKIKPLAVSLLYNPCLPKQLDFKTTNDVKELNEIIGQDRAMESLNFGIRIQHSGFNLYVLGPAGLGKHAIIKRVLHRHVSKQSCPDDWCYVNNFNDPRRPVALRLKSGYAEQLRNDMETLIEDVRISIPAVFESDDYRARISEIDEKIKAEQEQQFENLQKQAEAQGFSILSTPHGFAVAPTTKEGEVISAEDYSALKISVKKKNEKKMKLIKTQLTDLLAQTPRWQKLNRESKKNLQKELAHVIVKYLLKELKKKYKAFDSVIKYLAAVENDIIENVADFSETEEQEQAPNKSMQSDEVRDFSRYQVNVLVSHRHKGVPIIYEDNPTYLNLIGRTEQKAQLGALVTDFTLIRSGSFHRANGGYLLVDAAKILSQPYAWSGLKRVLYAKEIDIEPIGEMFGVLSTISLQPQAIPVNLKVIMIGDRWTYYLLCEKDPDFKELFKVEVDFSEDWKRTAANQKLYARLLARLIKTFKLHPFNSGAIARVIEHSSRLVGDAKQLSLNMRSLVDLLCEADHWAESANRKTVKLGDVITAISAQQNRANRVQHKLYEEIERGNLLIATDGAVVGQINALSVLTLGDYQFGLPARITATARPGKGEIINIEREANLSGDILAKAVLILTGFLSGRYATDRPLSLTASLVFEQNYSEIDGDSASIAELCALLSAIAEVPILQSFAITGSINQHGFIQAIGGVNDKIEGFFTICNYKGLTGKQGVIIPAANVKNLMLDKAVRTAVAAKKFHIFAIETVDDALLLLTGWQPGQRDKNGRFTPGSFNALIEDRLREYALHYEGEQK